MIRVLQITTLPVSMRLFVKPLAEVLTNAGYQVELAYGGPDYQSFDPFPAHHLPLTRNPFHPANGRGLWQLAHLMRARRYNSVHVHTPVAGVIGRLAAYIAGVPTVMYTLHGSFWGTQPAWRNVLFDAMERLLAPITTHVFVLNGDDYTDLLQRCHLTPETVTRMPVGGAGVDFAQFEPNRFPPEQVIKLRQNLGLSQSDIVVGYVGRIDRDKGIEDLLQAIAQLRPNMPEINSGHQLRLMLVGDRIIGDRATMIDTVLAELGETVVCAGFCDDIPAMIACMDLVVSSSYRDGFGMILAEAAAMGKAVVATATRGTQSAVVDGVTGLLTPIGDITALTTTLARLISDTELRVQLGQAARQRAIARFDQRKVMAVYQTTYERILG